MRREPLPPSMTSAASRAPWTAFPRLETDRLVLREITLDDAPFWLENFSEEDVVRFTADEPPAGLEGARAEIRRFCLEPFEKETGIRWGIVLREVGSLVGTCGYFSWDRERSRGARMGYDLLRAYRRRGIMTEALRAQIRYGFEAMGLHRMEARVEPSNEASIRLLRRLGFTLEGTLRETTYFRGRFQDDLCFSLLEHEWRGA